MELTKKRIYIADDDDNIRHIIKTFLVNDGYEIEDFSTGDDLLERFAKVDCNLVILDVMMPGSDGFAVLAELRKRSLFRLLCSQQGIPKMTLQWVWVWAQTTI